MSWVTGDGIKVFTRKDWGAKPPKAAYTPLGPLRSVVIHHGGPVGGPRWTFAKAAQTCRDWQAFHQGPQRGWNDIGYHYLVDARGRRTCSRRTRAGWGSTSCRTAGRTG
jgi:hypothetical protein